MQRSLTLCFIFLAALTLQACTKHQRGQEGILIGASTGAVIGQAIGRNTEATLIGAALGTLVGYIVGNEMDKFDRRHLNHVYEKAPSHRPTSWVNPDTGHQYKVTPQPAYTAPKQQQPCRRAEIVATINGKQEITHTTACRDAQGQWQLQ